MSRHRADDAAGDHRRPPGLLVRARLPHPPALGRGGGGGDHAPGDVPARAGPAAVARGLRPALAPARPTGATARTRTASTSTSSSRSSSSPRPRTCRTSTCAASPPSASTPPPTTCRFEEDNWESPTLGAWGIGWQVLLDGQEITQFTYFQQAGGIDLAPISAEITYGLERIAMYLQDVDDVYELRWSPDVPYGEVRQEEEYELSRYSFELADVDLHRAALRQLPGRGLAGPRDAGRPRRAARLRLVPEELARLQRARRAGRHLREPARGHDPGHPQAGLRHRGAVRASAPPAARRPVAEFLLEVGCEEMPASWLPGPASEQLASASPSVAGRERLEPATCAWRSDAARLAGPAPAVVDRQADREEQVLGPALRVAKDAGAAWTRRGAGLRAQERRRPGRAAARRQGPRRPELNLVFVRKTRGGGPTVEVLPAVIAQCAARLAFPKRMSWDAWIDDGKGRSRSAGRSAGWWRCSTGGWCRSRSTSSWPASRGDVKVAIWRPDSPAIVICLSRQPGGIPIHARSFEEYQNAAWHKHCVMIDTTRSASERIKEQLATYLGARVNGGGLENEHCIGREVGLT